MSNPTIGEIVIVQDSREGKKPAPGIVVGPGKKWGFNVLRLDGTNITHKDLRSTAEVDAMPSKDRPKLSWVLRTPRAETSIDEADEPSAA